jgi:uncharacterized protein YdaU (DUF1376 family)
MNYYEHHIGDYAEATAHLSFIEDAAYSRLIRKYYATEKPLPADLKQVQRLVGARTKEEKSAVETVLQEFFYLDDDGWHQERCDRVIADFQDGEPEREIKKANEETRLKRHREERSRLFSLLNQAGQHAPWNLPMGELRTLVQRYCNVPATPPATPAPPLPATAPATPATATQTPDTNTQSPIPNTQVCKDTQGGGSPTRAGAVCVALRAEGLSTVNPSHPDLLALLDDGAEIQEFVSAARIAKEKGKGFPYVIGIVKGQRADAQRMAAEAKDKPRQGANHDGHDVEEPA